MKIQIPAIPVPRTAAPRTTIGRWFFSGDRLDAPQRPDTHPWYDVLWLTGVDYFSTLGYQPGIALIAAASLAPTATFLLVLVTLLGALPVYSQVASRSYAGQGSIAMLEDLFSGWTSKIVVLVLLGFAGTDFIITITLSAADATQHLIENPLFNPYLGEFRLGVTLFFLMLLSSVFLKGFREAIGIAKLVAIPYLGLTLAILLRALLEILNEPHLIQEWHMDLRQRGDWTSLLLASAFLFPKLALGMSGYETGVSVMPLIKGELTEKKPESRIRATRKMLAVAAILMCGMLVLSSWVTTLLIPEEMYRNGAPASGRAIAFLCHKYLGSSFGTVYDAFTILILWFAGASALAGMLNLIPRYLPRFGMAPRSLVYRRPLVIVLFLIAAVITYVFDADVEAQGGAYATGVLALMLSAAVAVAISFWKERLESRAKNKSTALSLYFWIVSAIFAFTLIDNVVERPDGAIISSIFILLTLTASGISRFMRSTEMRVAQVSFGDGNSLDLWPFLKGKKVHLVPMRTNTTEARQRKTTHLRKYYVIEGPIAFIHVRLLDNRSEFLSELELHISKEAGNFVITVNKAIAVANTVAYISELIDPKSIFIGLTGRNLMAQSLNYLLLGEGETGMMIYKILLKYWEWTTEEDVRPLLFLMSE